LGLVWLEARFREIKAKVIAQQSQTARVDRLSQPIAWDQDGHHKTGIITRKALLGTIAASAGRNPRQ
jgi:hypothetical protein